MSDLRVFQPQIIETKEELLTALRNGSLKSSKYNLLTENEKLLVELICFGGYTAEQAIKAIDPKVKSPAAIASRMMSNSDVQATIEELTVAKNKKFMAEINNSRDLALRKLEYIMTTTNDDALAAACAKTILDKTAEINKNITDKEEPVGNVTFKIAVENVNVSGESTSKEPVIIDITPEEEQNLIDQAKKDLGIIQEETEEAKVELNKLKQKANTLPLDPDTGLPYTISYQSVDNYHDK